MSIPVASNSRKLLEGSICCLDISSRQICVIIPGAVTENAKTVSVSSF